MGLDRRLVCDLIMHIPMLTMGMVAAAMRSGGSLRDSLVEWWDFEDNSAATVFTGQKNSHPLNLINAQTTATQSNASGRRGRASNWSNANSNDAGQVPRAVTAFDFGDQSFTFGMWVNFNQMPSDDLGRFLMGRYGDFTTSANYGLFIGTLAGAQRFQLIVRNSAAASSITVQHATAMPLTTGAWHLVIGAHDHVNDELVFYVDNVKMTQSWSQGINSGGTGNFSVGNGRKGDNTYLDTTRTVGHKADSVFVMNRLITDGEVNYLWNAGAGKNYADLIADGM